MIFLLRNLQIGDQLGTCICCISSCFMNHVDWKSLAFIWLLSHEKRYIILVALILEIILKVSDVAAAAAVGR